MQIRDVPADFKTRVEAVCHKKVKDAELLYTQLLQCDVTASGAVVSPVRMGPQNLASEAFNICEPGYVVGKKELDWLLLSTMRVLMELKYGKTVEGLHPDIWVRLLYARMHMVEGNTLLMPGEKAADRHHELLKDDVEQYKCLMEACEVEGMSPSYRNMSTFRHWLAHIPWSSLDACEDLVRYPRLFAAVAKRAGKKRSWLFRHAEISAWLEAGIFPQGFDETFLAELYLLWEVCGNQFVLYPLAPGRKKETIAELRECITTPSKSTLIVDWLRAMGQEFLNDAPLEAGARPYDRVNIINVLLYQLNRES